MNNYDMGRKKSANDVDLVKLFMVFIILECTIKYKCLALVARSLAYFNPFR